MIAVEGEEALAAFRNEWTGRRVLDELQDSGGRLLVRWAVGVGKSFNIDEAIAEAILGGRYDLVVALFPLTALIHERRWMRRPPEGVRVVHLRSRPTQRCGALDETWRSYERRGLAALGRRELCSGCPHAGGCFWPRQYGRRLRGAQVVFATQAQLECSPHFLAQVQRWAGAERMLVVLDEVNFLGGRQAQAISLVALRRYADALEDGPERGQVELLERCTTADLQRPEWRFRLPSREEEARIQRRGVAQYGEAFRYLGYDLAAMSQSELGSREKGLDGAVRFAAPPRLPEQVIVYSGTCSAAFAEHRIGGTWRSPCEDHRFRHPDTRWYNLNSHLGAERYFRSNAPQILDFFAQLIARRLREGKRPLVLSKKRLRTLCRTELEQRIAELGLPQVRVLPAAECDDQALADPWVVPLLHYGLIGVNRFEAFDAAYCLNSYYVNEQVVSEVLQELLPSDERIALRIATEGLPRRRKIGAADPKHRHTSTHRLAPAALQHLEQDVVLQAVGRVRPFTKPREIVAFQAWVAEPVAFDRQFDALSQARQFFDCPSRRDRARDARQEEVLACRAAGLTQRQTVERLQISLATVKRRWNAIPTASKLLEGVTKPIKVFLKGS